MISPYWNNIWHSCSVHHLLLYYCLITAAFMISLVMEIMVTYITIFHIEPLFKFIIRQRDKIAYLSVKQRAVRMCHHSQKYLKLLLEKNTCANIPAVCVCWLLYVHHQLEHGSQRSISRRWDKKCEKWRKPFDECKHFVCTKPTIYKFLSWMHLESASASALLQHMLEENEACHPAVITDSELTTSQHT